MKKCPFCAEDIQDAAIVCKHCQRDLVSGRPGAAVVVRSTTSPGIAAVLSLLLPGAGQMYCGHVGAGIAWFVLTALGYAAFVAPGVLLHVLAIFNAASCARRVNADPALTSTLASGAASPATAAKPYDFGPAQKLALIILAIGIIAYLVGQYAP